MCTSVRFCSALCLALFPLAPLGAMELGEINVTASRVAQTTDQSLASVTVLDREDIERLQALSLTDLLDGFGGISVRSNGGLGMVSSLHLRGTNSGHVLLLIDGVKAAAATTGVPPWHGMSTSEIERIEVVRGPRSHLYGSEAVGGVIQVFTRAQGTGPRLEMGGGSQGTGRVAAGWGFGEGDSRLSLSVAALRSEGFDATPGNHPDDDGMKALSLAASLRHRFSPLLELGVQLNHADQQSDYDGWLASDDFSADYLRQSLSGGLYFSPGADWNLQLTGAHFVDEEQDQVNGLDSMSFDTQRRQLGVQGDWLLGDQAQLVAGLDWSREEVAGSSQYAISQRDQRAWFMELQGSVKGLDLSAGVRQDHYSGLGDHTTGNLALGWRINEDLRLSGSLGTAFKAPTFNDLYYVDPWGSSGNPELHPEESYTAEIGLMGRLAQLRWDVRLYHTEIDDLIQWSETAPWVWTPQNIAKARIRGLELSASRSFADWRSSLQLSLLDAQDDSSGNLLPLRSPVQLRLDLDRQLGKLALGATWRLRGASYSDAANRQRLGGHGRLDVRAEYAISPAWSLRGRVSNLLDQRYREAADYNTSGRTWFLSVVYEG